MNIGIVVLGSIAFRADDIKYLRNNGATRPMAVVDHSNKVISLEGTVGADFDEAVQAWRAALGLVSKMAIAEKGKAAESPKAKGKKKASKKTASKKTGSKKNTDKPAE